jgi:hypothetical protein
MKIFVFGSNLAGRHLKGDALNAYVQHGAVYGEGLGLHGHSYAIPTHDKDLRVLPLSRIQKYVEGFIRFAQLNSSDQFIVTRVGCSIPGYEDSDMAPMFAEAPSNCILPVGWRNIR